MLCDRPSDIRRARPKLPDRSGKQERPNRVPTLKLSRFAALLYISEIPFLDSGVLERLLPEQFLQFIVRGSVIEFLERPLLH